MIPIKFEPYCQSIGIVLLQEDLRYITEALRHIARNEHRSVLKRYTEEWVIGVSECNDRCKEVNAGRYRANIWLRERVDL
jgi:hypothetical protein